MCEVGEEEVHITRQRLYTYIYVYIYAYIYMYVCICVCMYVCKLCLFFSCIFFTRNNNMHSETETYASARLFALRVLARHFPCTVRTLLFTNIRLPFFFNISCTSIFLFSFFFFCLFFSFYCFGETCATMSASSCARARAFSFLHSSS